MSGGRGPAGRVGAARCRSGTERLSQAALLEPEALCRGRRVRTQCPGSGTDGAGDGRGRGVGGPAALRWRERPVAPQGWRHSISP